MQKKLIMISTMFLIITLIRLIFIIFVDDEKYLKQLKVKTEKIVYGSDAPRGRILDKNGRVIVENKRLNAIFYHKNVNISAKKEIKIASTLSKYLVLNKTIDEKVLKDFWIISNNEKQKNLITEEEYQLYQERKLNNNDLLSLKYERITPKMLQDIDEKTAYMYNAMNSGYRYSNKLLLEKISDEEYAKIVELSLPGVFASYTWQREYPYGEAMRSVLGSVGSIPKDQLDAYLSNGYQINDKVGISYLELQYEDYLRGEKSIYEIGKNNSLVLKKEEKKGHDVVLSIDIEKQVEIENILQEKIIKAKKEANTKFYKESYIVISNPNNGAIEVMAGKRILNNDSWQDVTSNIINDSFTVGSVVKGASIAVGYKNNIIDIGTKMKDSCVKLYLTPQKCSFKNLGVIDDLKAIMNSSNYYQFQIAIGITGNTYTPNMKLNATKEHFELYRSTFQKFGLGGLTNIDLPKEKVGINGKIVADDLLLNLAIGQYDTYTPIQILQYINTVSNGGTKYKPQLMSKVVDNTDEIFVNNYEPISKVEIDSKYMNRIRDGMNLVLMKGTGRGHVAYDLNPAGKTGTSESLYDSDNDNIGDVMTVTKVFAGFIPYENPKYSLVVISPHVSYDNPSNSFTSNVNRHITREVTDFLFEK